MWQCHNKRSSSDENVTDALGNNVWGESVGDVQRSFCNKYGEEQGKATIQETVYLPDTDDNLFSILQID